MAYAKCDYDPMGENNARGHASGDHAARALPLMRIWQQDGTDWTWTYFNRKASLSEAASTYGGCENPDGKGWVFTDFDDARNVCKILGGDLQIDATWIEVFGEESRNITLRPNKRQQLVVEIVKKKGDKPILGFIEEGRKFVKLIRDAKTEAEKLPEEELDLDNQ